MKSFKSIIALVLCAVMLVGIVPMAINPTEVAAATPNVETAETGIIQGSNDLVIVYNEVYDSAHPECHLLGPYLAVLTTTSGNQASTQIENVGSYDRVIVVWSVDTALPFQTQTDPYRLYAAGNTGKEHVVWTQKCTITNADNVYYCNSGTYTAEADLRKKADFVKATDVDNGDLLNYYDSTINANCTFTFPENAREPIISLGFAMEWNYINIDFADTTTSLIYCNGFDFTVGEKVNITKSNNAGYPIILNGALSTDGKYTGYSSEAFVNNTQTITVNGGIWNYIAPRVRQGDTTYSTSDKTINLVLGGNAIFKKNKGADDANQTAFISFEDYSNCTFNVIVDGATFEGPVYLVGARQGISTACVAPTISDSILNVTIESGTFNKGISTQLPTHTNTTQGYDNVVAYSNIDLDINLSVESITLGSGTVITGESPKLDTIKSTAIYSNSDYAGIFSNFDTVKQGCTSHKVANNVDGEGNFTFYGCLVCNEKISDVPVVFYNASLGSDVGHTGATHADPFDSMINVGNALKELQRGGVIVVCGPSYPGAYTIPDIGGDLTITSKFNSIDYRTAWLGDDPLANIAEENKHDNMKTGDACLVTVTHLAFSNDTVIENLDIMQTENFKPWYANYHDLTIMETVKGYKNDGGYKEDNPPVKAGTTAERFIHVVTGSPRADAADKTRGARDFGVQVVDIRCANIWQVLSGNKSGGNSALGSSLTESVSGETPTGVTHVYIGDTANIRAVDTYTEYNGYDITTYVHINDKMKFQHYQYAADGIKTSDNGKSFTAGKIIILTAASQMATSAERIYVYDADFFGDAVYGVRNNPETNGYAVRLGYKTSAEWVDKNGVAEFGVLMSTAANKDNILYVSKKGKAVDGVAKSVAYDDVLTNYSYDGISDDVTFRGVLVYDENTYDTDGGTIFSAVPYAVVPTKDNGGNVGYYTVIGATTDFNYNGIVD